MKLLNVFSDTHQLTRITILAAVALVLAVATFGGYYYYDRFYASEPSEKELSLAQAEQAVRDDPQNLDKRLVLAETYLLNQRYADSITQAQQVLIGDPESERAWVVVGVASAISGKPADAIEPLTKFINARKDEEMPGLDKALQAAAYYLGDSYLQLGRPQDAIEPLRQAVAWSKTDADSMYKLGMAYMGVQDYPKAVYMFHSATTMVPNFLEAYEAMAQAYDAGSKTAYADYARGMAAYSQENYSEAIELLLKSAQAEPGFAPTFTGLGLAYEALENLTDAKSAYQAAVNLDPNNFSATIGLERVANLLNK